MDFLNDFDRGWMNGVYSLLYMLYIYIPVIHSPNESYTFCGVCCSYEKKASLFKLLLWSINPAWAPNWLNRHPKCLLGHLRYKNIRYVIYSYISYRHFTTF